MADSPVWFRFFIEDFERDTRDLTCEEVGIYLRLMLWHYSRAEPIPTDIPMGRIAARIGLDLLPQERPDPIGALQRILDKFYPVRAGVYRQKRTEVELARWRGDIEKKRSAASERWHKINGSHAHALHPQSIGNANQNQNQNQNQKKDKKPRRSISAERSALDATAPPQKIVESIPLNDKTAFQVTEDYAGELDRLFPAVDVPQTLREIRAWCDANPSRRKTRVGAKAFIVRWLTKEQDRHGR